MLGFRNTDVGYLVTSGANHHELLCGYQCFYIYQRTSTNYFDIDKKHIPARFMYANYQGTASYSYVGGANSHGQVDGAHALELSSFSDLRFSDIGLHTR